MLVILHIHLVLNQYPRVSLPVLVCADVYASALLAQRSVEWRHFHTSLCTILVSFLSPPSVFSLEHRFGDNSTIESAIFAIFTMDSIQHLGTFLLHLTPVTLIRLQNQFTI